MTKHFNGDCAIVFSSKKAQGLLTNILYKMLHIYDENILTVQQKFTINYVKPINLIIFLDYLFPYFNLIFVFF